jgi:diguanylate cyclase (GGDEF)-like protein/PAS domain S-box-containing protein
MKLGQRPAATILVVDDNAIMRKMVRLALESEGYRVLEAATGHAGLQVTEAERPDLILQDLLLPDIDGFELVQRLRALPHAADIPILAFSGFLSKIEQSHSLQAGFSDHLYKPVEASRLVQTVQAHLPSKHRPRPPARHRVLVADDDLVQLKLLKIRLEQHGFAVDTASDGEAALDLARANPPDAIVSDVLMPRLDGFRLCQAVRQDPALAHVPIVLASAAYTEESDRELAREAGATTLVLRTPGLEELIEALEASLITAHRGPTGGEATDLPLEDYTHRVIRQLERQVTINYSLGRRLSMLEARFSILATLAKSLRDDSNSQAVLDEMLGGALEAFAISKGVAYLATPQGLELRGQIGFPDSTQPDLARFFGQLPRLREAMQAGQPVTLPDDANGGWQREVLDRADASSMMIAPVSLFDERLGVLVTASNQPQLSEDWHAFAEALGAQVGQAIGLARALSQLRGNEERYRTIVETANEGIILLDAETRVTFVNPKMCEMLGYAPDEMIGHRMAEFIDPEQLPAVQRRIDHRREGAREQYDSHLRHKDGSELWTLTSASPLFDEQGRYAGSILLHTDVTARKRAEEALVHQALHDNLTQLPNRTLLHEHLRQAILTARRDRQQLGLLMLDLDRFKEVNDAFGHHYGDVLLQQIGPRLSSTLRESDTIARLGGDEFAVILHGVRHLADAELAARKIIRGLDAPFLLDDQTVQVGASIGIVLYPDDGEDPDTLLRRADVAMYTAKNRRGEYAFYKPDQDLIAATRLILTTELRHAVEHDELRLFYQPKVHFGDRRLVAVESLVRWQHPQRGFLGPDAFVPLAEQTGLIQPMTTWILTEALRQCHTWKQAGLDINVAVNESMRNLHDRALPEQLAAMLHHHGVSAHDLTVEITESMIMADPQRALEVVTALSDMGISLSIDDFGTGYSSLAYLKRLPVHEIKVDKSFVLDMVTDESDATIVRSTIDLAHNLGLEVTAEGVETQAMWQALDQLNCDIGQGYYIARPMPAAELERWLQQAQILTGVPA